MKEYVVQCCRKATFCQNLLDVLDFKVGPWFCHSIFHLGLFLFQLYVTSFFSLPGRETSLVSQFSESCCKQNKFLSWQKYKPVFAFIFLMVILRFPVHSVFHYFFSDRTPNVPKYFSIIPDKMQILFCIFSQLPTKLFQRQSSKALYASRPGSTGDGETFEKSNQWDFLRQIPTEKKELPKYK